MSLVAAIEVLLIGLGLLLLVPILMLALETLAAVLATKRIGGAPSLGNDPASGAERGAGYGVGECATTPPGSKSDGAVAALLIPAHNEERLIGQTLAALMPTLAPRDRVLVVADNCDDRTAAVAREAGAEVVERYDPQRRGKGHALSFGLDELAKGPPDVVIVLDADCLVGSGTIRALARCVIESGRPMQGLNLTDRQAAGTPQQVLMTLANVLTNLVRPLGLSRLGVPCRLMGTGMALPWPLTGAMRAVGGNLVEDMQLGLDLALAGHGAGFCPQARVTSALPQTQSAFLSQRTRWEHGHLRTALAQIPHLAAAAVRHASPRLLGMALDLSIPPLALLAGLWLSLTACAAGLWLAGGGWMPLALQAAGGLLMTSAVGFGWLRFCREQVPLSAFRAVPAYLVRKLPIYAQFLVRPQTRWVRTSRAAGPRSDLGERTSESRQALRGQAPSCSPCEAPSFSVLGVRILNIPRRQAIERLEEVIRRRDSRSRSVFFVNAHTLNLAAADPGYRDVLNAGDFVFGDGTGVRWAARLQGVRVVENLVGTDFTPELLHATAGRGYAYYLLGADPQSVAAAADYARRTFKGWRQAGYHHGYIREESLAQRVIEEINAARPDVLLVGMGNPLQERWLLAHRDRLEVPICMGIGGLFDLWAGAVSRAPPWLRRLGHEWIWRLYQQPTLKARRYLLGNPQFLARILRESISNLR
jgi:exopolysaccharide biosynthesis WecB/TagA/CpsF family protein